MLDFEGVGEDSRIGVGDKSWIGLGHDSRIGLEDDSRIGAFFLGGAKGGRGLSGGVLGGLDILFGSRFEWVETVGDPGFLGGTFGLDVLLGDDVWSISKLFSFLIWN